jgi:hypothetical protein
MEEESPGEMIGVSWAVPPMLVSTRHAAPMYQQRIKTL